MIIVIILLNIIIITIFITLFIIIIIVISVTGIYRPYIHCYHDYDLQASTMQEVDRLGACGMRADDADAVMYRIYLWSF